MSEERRTRRRFPLNLPLRFWASGRDRKAEQGNGEVVNISSQGVAFRTDAALAAGMSVRASIAWPVALGGECLLQLSIEGSVLRQDGKLAVVEVRKHEFRTNGRMGASGRVEAEVLARQFSAMMENRPATPPRPATRL
ncbi:MAG: PilZ domain-containing protein [Bryobacteraceae bacterium]|jgi:hypothetical protein